MHLLNAIQGAVDDGATPVALDQGPGDIVVLSAADSEIAALARAQAGAAASLRLANLLALKHPLSVDMYLDRVARHAKLIVVRLLGGRAYWTYGVDELVALARAANIKLALLPGDDQPDTELGDLSTLDGASCHRLWQYLAQGGPDNAREFLRYAASLIGHTSEWREPAPILRAAVYRPHPHPALPPQGGGSEEENSLPPCGGGLGWGVRPKAGIIFYRALVQADDMQVIDALIAALAAAGIDAVPVWVTSLKDPVAAATVRQAFAATTPDVIINATGFALGEGDPLAEFDCPVLQIAFSALDRANWSTSTRGLAARDIAMSVALPEVDGRIFTRAVAFKQAAGRDEATQTDIVRLMPSANRISFVAALAAAWVRLRRTPPADRKIALVLANYPNRDGRIANGVGLDTPESAAVILEALRVAGYAVDDAPRDGAALMSRLLAGPTNARPDIPGGLSLPRAAYDEAMLAVAPAAMNALTARWGVPERDPFYRDGFHLPLHRFGNIFIGIQPARGYNIDPKASYHDPALVPPHGYLAFYAALRAEGVHAVVHVGKHGNLEWLPGKSLALSDSCWPEAALGPIPHLYPFIVNDPGEGTQAKRRAAAVIVDHLTPTMTRAGSHGPQAALERLIDEYYEAETQDRRRAPLIAKEILEIARASRIAEDCGIAPDDPQALKRLDGYLCELKDLQIRDGLHVFGRVPHDADDLARAIARSPRGPRPQDESLPRALARDLGHAADPLAEGEGRLLDQLESLALDLVAGRRAPDRAWAHTRPVLDWIADHLKPALAASARAEIHGLLAGLAGRRVAPGPSGAPTRGRADVLPTGRNFYSVDLRAVPTPAAWALGWKSAALLLARHAQEHGEYPRAVALSAWGTSNMRTGGDDIAQGLALMGVRPTWDGASRRVTGFEILPPDLLDRPRVDVTLRVSGFFRDAFPNLIDLFDSAVRAVAALDEPPAQNPLAARAREDAAKGRLATARVFGSKPGAYGAGLQALIDERGWETADDLAKAYVAWGGFAYGAGLDGVAAPAAFQDRLARVRAVIQNQDNREHDLLDSDDYYQFAGGLAAAVKAASGMAPVVYHNDHALADSPRIRTLDEEIARVVRGRAANPKWIAGVMRHGYKGAFEMAATVDYLFAFAATTGAVRDHHFDQVFAAYLDDPRVRDFCAAVNPAALNDMATRFAEAIERGLWHPRANHAREIIARITESA